MHFLITIFVAILLLIVLGRRQAASAMHGHALASQPPPYTSQSFTLGIYNIHRARGTDGKKDLNRIARTIGNADVIGLCEVEGPASPWHGIDQCTQLGKKLQLGSLFSPTQKRWGRFDRGNGLLSRIPVSSWYQEPLVDSTATHPRCLLRADLQIGDQIIPLFVTHLARRQDQAIQLQTLIDRFSQHPCAILIGDLNLNRNDPQLAAFLQQDTHIDAIALNSKQTEKPDDPERIDWIICKGLKTSHGGSEAIGASDHPYYWVELEIE